MLRLASNGAEAGSAEWNNPQKLRRDTPTAQLAAISGSDENAKQTFKVSMNHENVTLLARGSYDEVLRRLEGAELPGGHSAGGMHSCMSLAAQSRAILRPKAVNELSANVALQQLTHDVDKQGRQKCNHRAAHRAAGSPPP